MPNNKSQPNSGKFFEKKNFGKKIYHLLNLISNQSRPLLILYARIIIEKVRWLMKIKRIRKNQTLNCGCLGS